ncbi:MAG: rhodanese-like domain-containing protein [Spirochaetota bacterium]|nr:rhodanese-like domain-containing protein [Spirochaetota bacterium]
MKQSAFIFLLACCAAVFAFCSPKPQEKGGAPEFGKVVVFATLQEWLNDTETQTIVIDLRRDDEIVSGMIPGARHIPVANLEARINEIPKNARIVLYCSSGNRVKTALPVFEANGYTLVYSFVTISNWKGPLEYP